MAQFEGHVFGPQLDAIEGNIRRAVDILIAFFRGDKELRQTQAENEPLADGMQQGSNVNGVDTMTVTPNGLTTPTQLQQPFTTFLDAQTQTGKKYSYIIVILKSTSGQGFYTLQSGIKPNQAGTIGHEIPAGGTTLTIPGTRNIQNFVMCPATGATLDYSMQGFI